MTTDETCDYCDGPLPEDWNRSIDIDGQISGSYCSIACAAAHLIKLCALRPSEEEKIIDILTKREDLRPYARKS